MAVEQVTSRETLEAFNAEAYHAIASLEPFALGTTYFERLVNPFAGASEQSTTPCELPQTGSFNYTQYFQCSTDKLNESRPNDTPSYNNPAILLLDVLFDNPHRSWIAFVFQLLQFLLGALVSISLFVDKKVPTYLWFVLLPIATVALASILALPLQALMFAGYYVLLPLTSLGSFCWGSTILGPSLWKLGSHNLETFAHHKIVEKLNLH